MHESLESHCIALYVNAENVTYFDSFRVEHIPKAIRKFLGTKNVSISICRIQEYYFIVYRWFCVGFFDFMLKRKSLLQYANLISPNEYKKNDKIIVNYSQ